MSESQFGPRGGEADERTRAARPPFGAPQESPPQPQPGYQQPAPQQPAQQAFAQPGFHAPAPQPKAGYFRSLFDLSYSNLGAPKFARVFQLLFMIVSGLGVVFFVVQRVDGENVLVLVLGILTMAVGWLLLNTLVRLVLEAVVGIVQTAENSEQMLQIMRERSGS